MPLTPIVSASALLLTFALATPARAQMAPPSPGPEHALFTDGAGTWDATIEMIMPDGSTMKATGTEVDTVGCNGMCLITDFKADMMGMPFHGHGIVTWDPSVKKYVGSWTDSMSPVIARTEGTYDAATKTMTSVMETRDMTGAAARMRSTDEHPDADHKTMTSYMAGPDGKEVQAMKITYVRRK